MEHWSGWELYGSVESRASKRNAFAHMQKVRNCDEGDIDCSGVDVSSMAPSMRVWMSRANRFKQAILSAFSKAVVSVGPGVCVCCIVTLRYLLYTKMESTECAHRSPFFLIFTSIEATWLAFDVRRAQRTRHNLFKLGAAQSREVLYYLIIRKGRQKMGKERKWRDDKEGMSHAQRGWDGMTLPIAEWRAVNERKRCDEVGWGKGGGVLARKDRALASWRTKQVENRYKVHAY